MPVYNGLPHLKDAVKSILTQTYTNFEFIIVDDASADKSWQYLKELKDKRIKLIRNEKNLGVAKSLNIALKSASGEFIARMDADDISLPKRIETQVRFLRLHPSIDICGTWVDLINEKGQIIGAKKYPTKDKKIKNALAWFPPIIHPTMMIKAKAYRQLEGYDPRFDMAEDYDLLLRAKKEFMMANIPQRLLLLRLWENRRSRAQMHKMDKIDLKIKLEAFKKGYFGPLYVVTIVKKFLMTYLLPISLKVKIARLLKVA